MDDECIRQDWPADGLETVPTCPVCDAPARQAVHPALEDRIFHCAPGRWALWRCAACACGYLDPRPTPDSIGLAYAAYYTHEAPDAGFLSSATRVGARLPALRNAYLNARFPGLRLRPAWPFGGGLLRAFPDTRAFAERDVRHLPAPRPGDRLLDIGCGSGAFVRRALELGYQAEGLEFDPNAVASAQAAGLPVKLGALPATGLESGAYQVVTLSQVIEHLHDPRAALAEIHRLLAPGGWFWLATPNMDAPGHRAFGPDWRGLEPPRHLVLFSAGGLASALSQAGFGEIRFLPPGPVSAWFHQASQRIREQRPEHAASAGQPPEGLVTAAAEDRATRRDPKSGEELLVLARRA